MVRYLQVVGVMVVYLSVVVPTTGQEPPAKLKAKVEFRWLESKPIKGLTDEKGIRTTCGNELWYPHQKPILNNKDVGGTRLSNSNFSGSGLPGDHFTVTFQLTDQAKKTLVEACDDPEGKGLAVFVDGKYWGTACFRKCRTSEFTPSAGFISSRAEAEWIVEACK